ncbi:hypothetical protein FPOAC2_11911 [Fusarium poae]|jgi:hypothetical protein
MSTAQGVLTRNSADRITLVFVIDDRQVTFAGAVTPSVEPFSTNNVTLAYENVNGLFSSRSFNGQIGPNTFKFRFDNGVVATGDLSPPGVSPAFSVTGSGQWMQELS